MMNVNKFSAFIAIFVLFSTNVGFSMYGPNNNLNKYISKARSNEERQEAALLAGTPDLVCSGAAMVGGTSAAFFLNPALGSTALLYGYSAMATDLVYRLYKLHEYYSINAPFQFAKSLEELNNLINTEKIVSIGGKEYMVAKKFNDVADTGYLTNYRRKNQILAAACTAENQTSHSLTNQEQYEIYVMPDDYNLVYTFEIITEALYNKTVADKIAFIAIRPTPKLYNDAKQILPRIVIVLKRNASTKNAEEILKITYTALKEESYTTRSSKHWPRYSEKVVFADNAWNPISEKLNQIFFIGMGNTDFKSLHPESFERKKFLGITKRGDMAYPINTTAEEKLDTPIVIN